MQSEAEKLADLIDKDKRTKIELARILGVTPSYLSKLRASRNSATLSSDLAAAATRLWGLAPDYFKRATEPAKVTPADEQIIELLKENNKILTEILAEIKKP